MSVWGAATLVFLLSATRLPAVQRALKVLSPGADEWALAVGVATLGSFWMEGLKLVRRARALRH